MKSQAFHHQKVTISLPAARLARAKAAVSAGEASSLSAYVSEALSQCEERIDLEAVLNAMDGEYGPPSPEAEAWARQVLGI